jgi:hypothetical protein
MTIVIKGPLTTEKVETAVKQFEKETRIKNLKKKFWQLNINVDKTVYQEQLEDNEV